MHKKMLSSTTDLQATVPSAVLISHFPKRSEGAGYSIAIANPDRWKQILDPVFAGDLSQRPMA